MSKLLFSEEEIQKLDKNKYVLRVSHKAITYTDEFILHFIIEYNNGKQTRIIFEEAGLNVDLIGNERVKSAAKRWRKLYSSRGILGLSDTRKGNSGRPLERELSSSEIIERKDAEISYLKAELEIVKKLELNERQVKNNKLEPWRIFSLIMLFLENL